MFAIYMSLVGRAYDVLAFRLVLAPCAFLFTLGLLPLSLSLC